METPNIKIENDVIVRETFEVPIMINGQDKVVKMTKLSTGNRREIIKKYVKAEMNEKSMTSEVKDIMGIQVGTLSAAIIEAPFKTTEEELCKLPEDVIDYLYEAYKEHTQKKKTQLD